MIHTAPASYTDIFPIQQKTFNLNRLQVSLDMKVIHHTLGSAAWLANLTQDEFQNLLSEILPAIEQERIKRKPTLSDIH